MNIFKKGLDIFDKRLYIMRAFKLARGCQPLKFKVFLDNDDSGTNRESKSKSDFC